MKVAVTTRGKDLDAALDPRFGRAERFLLYHLESGSFEIVDNQVNLTATQGAGVQAAATVARSGAECLLTGHCGPKAFQVLASAGIRVYLTDAPTVAAALDRLRQGELQPAASADVDGHWA
jgi:predicted Fe-Mo cluster-binding NifX family protein